MKTFFNQLVQHEKAKWKREEEPDVLFSDQAVEDLILLLDQLYILLLDNRMSDQEKIAQMTALIQQYQ